MNESYTELVEVTAMIYNAGEVENTDYLYDETAGIDIVWCIDKKLHSVDAALKDEPVGDNRVFVVEAIRFTFRTIANPACWGGDFDSFLEYEINDQSTTDVFENDLPALADIARRRAKDAPQFNPVTFIAAFSYSSFTMKNEDGYNETESEWQLLGELDLTKLEGAIIRIHSPEDETGAATNG